MYYIDNNFPLFFSPPALLLPVLCQCNYLVKVVRDAVICDVRVSAAIVDTAVCVGQRGLS